MVMLGVIVAAHHARQFPFRDLAETQSGRIEHPRDGKISVFPEHPIFVLRIDGLVMARRRVALCRCEWMGSQIAI
jgi:hypothetical protein